YFINFIVRKRFAKYLCRSEIYVMINTFNYSCLNTNACVNESSVTSWMRFEINLDPIHFYAQFHILTPELHGHEMKLFVTILHKFYYEKTVLKIAISLANICDDQYVQLQLFEYQRLRERKLGYVMDAIRNKFGSDSLLRAISYTDAGTARKRNQMIGGHFA